MASVVLARDLPHDVQAPAMSQYQRGLVILTTTRLDGVEFVTACWPGQERETIESAKVPARCVWKRDHFFMRFVPPNWYWEKENRYGQR
jgi:hypothetical protein